jgi:hypothetical protein
MRIIIETDDGRDRAAVAPMAPDSGGSARIEVRSGGAAAEPPPSEGAGQAWVGPASAGRPLDVDAGPAPQSLAGAVQEPGAVPAAWAAGAALDAGGAPPWLLDAARWVSADAAAPLPPHRGRGVPGDPGDPGGDAPPPAFPAGAASNKGPLRPGATA